MIEHVATLKRISEITPTFRSRSPTMLRAEILADGVSGEFPQPAVNTKSMNIYIQVIMPMVLAKNIEKE